jgi:hypothetical protein
MLLGGCLAFIKGTVEEHSADDLKRLETLSARKLERA